MHDLYTQSSVIFLLMSSVKIVYADRGSFGLSPEALTLYAALANVTDAATLDPSGLFIERTDPHLARVVEQLGDRAARNRHSHLAVRALPKGTRYIIQDFDGGGEDVKTMDEFDWLVV